MLPSLTTSSPTRRSSDLFKGEETVAQANLLWRRGGEVRHVSGHMSDREIEPDSTGYVPSAKSLPDGRRNFRTADKKRNVAERTEEHTYELQSLMRISYAVFCLKNKTHKMPQNQTK